MALYSQQTQAEVVKSQFNAALGQMERIHKLQQTINYCRINMTGKFKELGVETDRYNFEVFYQCVNGLVMEAFGKLGDIEKEKILNIKKDIRVFMKRYPVYTINKTPSNTSTLLFNEINWDVLEDALIKYESLVREMLDLHGMNSPDQDDEGYF